MEIYTIWNNGIFTLGTTVILCGNKKAKEYPGISIGEDGPGRKRTSIKVKLLTRSQRQKWINNNHILNIVSATIEKDYCNEYVLFASEDRYNDPDENILCVFRTHNGYCGTNFITGDIIDGGLNEFKKFPGKKLKCGKIIKGLSIETGVGRQLIAVVPRDCIFHTSCLRKVFVEYPSSFFYGLEHHFYMFDGKRRKLQLLGGFSLRERYQLGPI